MISTEATRLLMRICAARHDQSVASSEFVGMLEELVDKVHAAALREALGTDDPELDDRVPPPERVPLASAHESRRQAQSAASKEGKKNNKGNGVDTRGRRPDGSTWSRQQKLTDDDRLTIRTEFESAKESGERIIDWMEMAAIEYGVAVATIKNVCYRQGD